MEGAQKWLRQAEADMNTAKHLLQAKTGYEWACHICCEVIRKVMVATILGNNYCQLMISTTYVYSLHQRIPESYLLLLFIKFTCKMRKIHLY